MEPSSKTQFQCGVCLKYFRFKANLNRHMQLIHNEERAKAYSCPHCSKTFNQKGHLESHARQHLYPSIRMYKPGEAMLQSTPEAKAFRPESALDQLWLDPASAEAKARQLGNDQWRLMLVMTFGKFQGKSYKWLLENDVGWVVWLLAEYCLKGESNMQIKWQKQQLLDLVKEFPAVNIHLERKLQKAKDIEGAERSLMLAKEMEEDPGYVEDSILLTQAEEALQQSQVSTHLTSVKELEITAEFTPDPEAPALEGWQRSWEGSPDPNIKWLKENDEYGLFTAPIPYRSASGEVVYKRVLKKKINFYPPPMPISIKASLPSMYAFFTSPVIFWRPVGVMEAKIPCPNKDCPAPPGSFLSKHGFGSTARQVCGMRSFYTLLTERLVCYPCKNARQQRGENEETQYSFHSYSPRIMMKLSPAVRSLFPAVICGKRAIDKDIAVILSDRLNAVSMTKVHRLVQRQHDQWYMERRGMYQTLLYQGHMDRSSILSYTKKAGSYIPPMAQTPLPSSRVLRRAHLVMEMEKIPEYRASILSTTGEILCIDGTKQILKKVYGDGRGSLQYVTSILNEWGQFLTTVVVASESEECYRRMARGLIERFKRADAPAPRVLYTDNNCCRDGGESFYETLFSDWVEEGMVVRLDIRHWLHRWDSVVIKQSHAKYGVFMSALAGAVLAFNKADLLHLVKAVRAGNEQMYSKYSDTEMIAFVKPHQFKSYVRRVTRGVEATVCAVEAIIDEFKGPAGLDVDGIPLFKSHEAVDIHWARSSQHINCLQDPPGIPLYVTTKTVSINGVDVQKYRCRRGSNALEGLHSHLVNAIPSKRCGIMPFQVYLISFAAQWNHRMESLRVAGGQGRKSSCTDPRQVQLLNQQSEVLFGREHLFEPNFTAPMPFPEVYNNEEEEELLGIEYAYAQSTDFKSASYYVEKVEEEQSREDGDEEGAQTDDEEDEGIVEDEEEQSNDPLDEVNVKYSIFTTSEQVTELSNPVLEDVLMGPSHLHLPGYEEVEHLALQLVELAAEDGKHLVPPTLRNKIITAASNLQDHDKSTTNFVKKYESKWGYTLFGRCLGPDSPQSSAAQKTKFGWMRYAQAAQITEESRLLYLLIKILKNKPPTCYTSSPSRLSSLIKAHYKRIVDRVRDDPMLCSLNLPLPNINAKSISAFLTKEEKKANYVATSLPKVKTHQRVLSEAAIPEADTLPSVLLPPRRPQVQYPVVPFIKGIRPGQKRKLDFNDISPQTEGDVASASSKVKKEDIKPKPVNAPVLIVLPSQPKGPSVICQPGGPPVIKAPLPPLPAKITMPNKSSKPCALCKVPKCGGKRRRYTPSKEKTSKSKQKIFTFCPTTKMSTTAGFEKEVFKDYEDFKSFVDQRLAQL
ncbi:uncharacterized protein LOC106171268 [Lingula anatina]|uniref:Uncharacterized protein LOC106171268 n=1 Tax=Lingula anatina TaxID=7574 RepID=A0A1S3J9C1_LINAN|nr:uncharacterized protein LOC106171268 [Lingula anatina]|eukprot:XP_013407000.1 uncharacterized protein LOC106171268 [Lingula anatina]